MTGPAEQWAAALRDGRLLFQRARGSGTVFFPPRLAEPGSGDRDWEWVEAPALATIYSVTVLYPRDKEPRAIALVDFQGGGRMMGAVEGMAADDIAIGMRVEPKITAADPDPVVSFVIAGMRS